MLRSLPARTRLVPSLRCEGRLLSSTASTSVAHAPNPPLELDPSMRSLLKDADMDLIRGKTRHGAGINSTVKPPRELEIFPQDPLEQEDYLTHEELVAQDLEIENKSTRKSPAAHFGSQRIGAVVLPSELHQTINRLIAVSDKPMLHTDAKRLFMEETETGSKWDTAYDTRYKSRKQYAEHAERDGTAFASVVLPAHYSAIAAVLDHVKQRLGPEWSLQHVIDWGAGTGSGLWAASHTFQESPVLNAHGEPDPQLSTSTLQSYLGIDKRDGLVAIGKRLLQDLNLGNISVSRQRSFQDQNQLSREDGLGVMALSAFALSSLPTPLARKQLVKEMWESGAELMVLIDHKTTSGFESIAEAREYLLSLGKKEIEDPDTEGVPVRGSHVVAPCPHDGRCPLYGAGPRSVVCGFSQRLQRPDFVRKTKHSKVGHEDIEYSYVVIRRGARPARPQEKVGRVGDIGKRALEKISDETPMLELTVEGDLIMREPSSKVPASSSSVDDIETEEPSLSSEEVETSLRSEAYHWPRLVFPPLKRSGHIILDSCTAEGKIMRITIPKSQGKQPYYDARKSSWGDIFPHDPKNSPQTRFQVDPDAPLPVPHRQDKGADKKNRYSYAKLSSELKEKERHSRLVRRERRRQKEDADEDYSTGELDLDAEAEAKF